VEALYPLAGRYPGGQILADVVRAIFRASDGTLVAVIGPRLIIHPRDKHITLYNHAVDANFSFVHAINLSGKPAQSTPRLSF
jgi:hypothetical protein